MLQETANDSITERSKDPKCLTVIGDPPVSDYYMCHLRCNCDLNIETCGKLTEENKEENREGGRSGWRGGGRDKEER